MRREPSANWMRILRSVDHAAQQGDDVCHNDPPVTYAGTLQRPAKGHRYPECGILGRRVWTAGLYGGSGSR
jgi:hypothetical protein